jgi:excisionase family DNA binding protein
VELEGRATITVEEAAAILGIGRSAAYEAARRGQLPTRRLGRRLLVPVPALLAWLGAEDPSIPDDRARSLASSDLREGAA